MATQPRGSYLNVRLSPQEKAQLIKLCSRAGDPTLSHTVRRLSLGRRFLSAQARRRAKKARR